MQDIKVATIETRINVSSDAEAGTQLWAATADFTDRKRHRFQSVCSFESSAERTLFTVIGLSSPGFRPFAVASEVEGDGQGHHNSDCHIISSCSVSVPAYFDRAMF